MAYSEILNEIQEQIDDIQASITANTEAIAQAQAELQQLQQLTPTFQEKIAGLIALKANAEALVG